MKVLFALLICLAHHFSAFAQGSLVIDDHIDIKVLGSELSFFNDSTGQLDVQSALNNEFQSVQRIRPNLGFTDGALWVKCKIFNKSQSTEFRVLINEPALDSVFVFVFSNGESSSVKPQLTGQAIPFSKRENKDRSLIAEVNIPVSSSIDLVIKIATTDQISLPIYVGTPSGTWAMMKKAEWLLGSYFGLLIAMALYNLFIYFSIRDRSYLLYVVYIFFLGLTQATLEGYTQQFLWPENVWFALRSLYIFTAFICISSVIFLKDFLRTRVYIPIFHKITYVIYVYFIAIIAFSCISVSSALHILTQLGLMAVSIYIFVASVLVFKRGYTPAKFFLLAWSALLAGVIVFVLKDAGVIPSTPVTNYMLMVGSALEIVLLSIALADRINILKKEKAFSQAEALSISKENEKIVLEQNVELERKVGERTQDLEKTNKQLTNTVAELKNTQSQLVESEKMASLGQLTAGVAHEINNPINFVSGNIQPLRYDVIDILKLIEMYDSIDDEKDFMDKKDAIENFKTEIDINYVKKEIEQLLNGIEDGAQRTAEIVKGLKNFSRLDESNLKFTDLNEGLTSTFTILKGKVPDGVEVKLDLGVLPPVECLGGKINQVFMNVMNNALQSLEKADEKAKRFLEVKSWQEDDDVYFTFEDNGMGISEAARSKVFDPFFTTKDVGQGTGLGLSISFNIIETHKGKILVESVLGEGAKFTVRLPIISQMDSIIA